MMNVQETIAAEEALVFPSRDLPRDERVAAHDKYRADLNAITDQFRAYLAHTHLSGFNTAVQDAVWDKVREDGGGYQNMETNYKELAEIVRLV